MKFSISNARALGAAISLITATVTLPPVAALTLANCAPEDRMQVNLGYWESWAVWRADGCNRQYPEDIDVVGNGYTHLVYAFAAVGANYEIAAYNDADYEEIPMMRRFNAIKQEYPDLKTLIGVGGWTHNDLDTVYCHRFAEMSATATNRQTFALSVVNFCLDHGFDGVDLDWEYPGDLDRCGTTNDRTNYGLLVQAIRDAFDAGQGTQDFLISMAVPASISRLDSGYHLESLGINLDFVNLMSYDIHGYTWSAETGSHTDMRTIRPAVDHILAQGVPSTKLVLGLAAYGRTFSLSDPENCSTINCPFSGARSGGCAVHDAIGYTALATILDTISSGSYTSLVQNPETESMELVTNEGELISFDNQETLTIKASYALEQCLAGYMWWAVDLIAESFTLNFTPTISPAPTTSQTPTEAPSTTGAPSSAPTEAPPKCCDPNETKMKAYNGCTQYYWCNHGIAADEVVGPYPGYRFNEAIQNWDHDHGDFECLECAAPPSPPGPAPGPTPAPLSPTTPAPVGPTDKCCPPVPGYTMRAYNDCTQYYWCLNGAQLDGEVVGPITGLLFNEDLQNWDYETSYTCPGDPCDALSPTSGPTSEPTSPSLAPVSNPHPQPAVPCCEPNENRMRAINDCEKYYWCVNGEPYDELVGPIDNYKFDEGIQNWVWDDGTFVCPGEPTCGEGMLHVNSGGSSGETKNLFT